MFRRLFVLFAAQILAIQYAASAGAVPANRVPTPHDSATSVAAKVPVINVTDLYHPYQDPQDNLDLIAAYALPEVDLRAIIFDVTAEYRKPSGQVVGLPRDDQGPREPGYIQVTQLNRIFGRNVPCLNTTLLLL